jgi:YesN/AraC family two-component response regulator
MESPNPAVSVLVVEDEGIILEFLVTTLAIKYRNITIYKAINGRTGLELFKEHRPDMVIIDISMPDISDVQMAKKILEIKPDTKFIVLTAHNEKLTVEDSIGNQFKTDHFIEKPVDFPDLFAAIDQCLGEILQQAL